MNCKSCDYKMNYCPYCKEYYCAIPICDEDLNEEHKGCGN